MAGLDINALAAQYQGRRFGELVLKHMQEQSLEQTVSALEGAIDALAPEIQKRVTHLLDNANGLAHKREFWADDCGRVLRFIATATAKELGEVGFAASDDELIDVFNVIVLNFAYSAHRDPRMKKFITSSTAGGFLAKLFGGN